MADRYFRPYVFPGDEDVLYVGLDKWIEMPNNHTPLLGVYMCSEQEVHARFDELETDLRRARRATLDKLKALSARRR